MEKIVVSIKDASVRYNLAMQKRHGLKDYFQALQRREPTMPITASLSISGRLPR